MRINVYAEEITERVEVVSTHVEETDATFIGIRFYLKTHEDMLPPKHPDDDSSAVTFWVKSKKKGFTKGDEEPLRVLMAKACELLGHLGA